MKTYVVQLERTILKIERAWERVQAETEAEAKIIAEDRLAGYTDANWESYDDITQKTGVREITEATKSTVLTNTTHPALFKAILHVAYDNDMINRQHPEPVAIYTKVTEHLAALAEIAVAKLNEEDLETFSIGEESDMKAIRDTDAHGLDIAGDILNEYFEGL